MPAIVSRRNFVPVPLKDIAQLLRLCGTVFDDENLNLFFRYFSFGFSSSASFKFFLFLRIHLDVSLFQQFSNRGLIIGIEKYHPDAQG